MYEHEIQSSGFVVPERKLTKLLAPGTTEIQSNAINDSIKYYRLHPLQESFGIDSETEESCQSLYYKSLELMRGSILDNNHGPTWKNNSVPVSGKKCCCHSVWCPSCFSIMYHDKVLDKFNPFDWKKTRQLTLTVNPDLFDSGSAAIMYIRENRTTGEFIRRLKRGVKTKVGNKWIEKYKPVKISRWAWFLEWHANGFPHYHIFIETPVAGSAGMIGADFIRDSWGLSTWVNESYFKNEEHFSNLTGYYAHKGYFDKGKKHQGILPDEIKENVKSRIKRYGSSPENLAEKLKNAREKKAKLKEDQNFKEVEMFFTNIRNEASPGALDQVIEDTKEIRRKLIKNFNGDKEKRRLDYSLLLASCGQKTFVSLDLGEYRLYAEVSIKYEDWKNKFSGEFVNGRGRVNRLNLEEINYVLKCVTRVTGLDKYQNIKAYCLKRCEDMEKFKRWQQYAVDLARNH